MKMTDPEYFEREAAIYNEEFIKNRYNGIVEILQKKFNLQVPEDLQKFDGSDSRVCELARFTVDALKLDKSGETTYTGINFLAVEGKNLPEDAYLMGIEDKDAFFAYMYKKSLKNNKEYYADKWDKNEEQHKAEKYAELDDFYKSTYRDIDVKRLVEDNEEKVQFVKENYPAIIEYLKKEYPYTVDAYYADTKQVDDRRIAVLATDASFFTDAKRNQRHIYDRKHFVLGLNKLAEIGENVTWSKEAYIRNFPMILDYLEKHDGLDVSEIREMYAQKVEDNRNNPQVNRYGELSILDPGPSVETKLTKLIEKAKYKEFSKQSGEREEIYKQAMKYYKVTALRAVLKEQKLRAARDQHRSNLNKIMELINHIKKGMKESTPIKNVSNEAPFKVNPKKSDGMNK